MDIWAHKQPNRNYDYSLAAHDRTWRRILLVMSQKTSFFSPFLRLLIERGVRERESVEEVT